MKTSILSSISIISLFLFINVKTQAQIICTDVNPDITNTGNATQDIDLNNDAVPDFRLTSAQAGILSFVIVQGSQIGTGNFVLTNGTGSTQALPLNAPISPTSTTWTQMNSTNQQMVLVTSGVAAGPWASAIDQYLGLKLVVGLNTYYGWARFSFTSNSNTYTFKDYAYQSTPNTAILAGQGCGSLSSPTFTLPNTMCIGSSATLTANTGTAVATTYNWLSSPAGAIFTASVSSVTAISFTSSGVYSVALVVTSGTTIGMTTNTLLINSAPTISISMSTPSICQGSSVAINASGSSVTFSWSPSTGLSQTTGTSVVANPGVTTTYTVTGSVGGCSNTTTATVNVQTPATFSANFSSPTLCAQPLNASVNTISVSLAGPAGYSFTSVAPAGINASNINNTSISFSTVPPYQSVLSPVTFTILGSNGVCSLNIPATCSIIPNPLIAISSLTPAICVGFSYVYLVTGTSIYTWSTSLPGSIVSATNNFASVQPSVTAIYSVFGTSQGCNSLTHTSTLTVHGIPTVSATNATVCVSETATLIASGALSYSWTGPGGYSSSNANAVIPSPSVAGTGVYTVTGSDTNSCTATTTTSLTIAACLGIEQYSRNAGINIFPNPFENNISVVLSRSAHTKIHVLNVTGKIVLSSEQEFIAGEKTVVKLENLPAGIYFLNVIPEGEGSSCIRLIKM